MSINVNTKKIVITIIVLLIAGFAGYSRYSTTAERKAEAEYDLLVRFAERQAVEIAIFEQRRMLLQYQKPKNTLPQSPVIIESTVADPKDISK